MMCKGTKPNLGRKVVNMAYSWKIDTLMLYTQLASLAPGGPSTDRGCCSSPYVTDLAGKHRMRFVIRGLEA